MAEPIEQERETHEGAPRTPVPEPGDDFFCLRYRIWYPSLDCAFRTKFATSQGCRSCDQGRFNLKRHARGLAGARFLLTAWPSDPPHKGA